MDVAVGEGVAVGVGGASVAVEVGVAAGVVPTVAGASVTIVGDEAGAGVAVMVMVGAGARWAALQAPSKNARSKTKVGTTLLQRGAPTLV